MHNYTRIFDNALMHQILFKLVKINIYQIL